MRCNVKKVFLIVAVVMVMGGCFSIIGCEEPPISQEMGKNIDTGVTWAEQAMAAFGGLIAAIPFGPLGLAVAATATTFWRKNKKLLVAEQKATREIVIGVQKGKQEGADLGDELAKATSVETKKIIGNVKATL